MKHMRGLVAVIVGSWMMAAGAEAFPSWMGVYGAFERHTTNENPGVYTILMNQDYFGLQAEVGVQVNEGAWNIFPMAYAGHVDGNSKWTFTPALSYPAGATVKFYFHGYDKAGGHLYDSRNAQNYAFSIPSGNSTGLTWGAAAQLPVHAGSYSIDLAAHNGALYAVWGTRSNEYDSLTTIWIAKKMPGAAWQAPQPVATLAAAYQNPRIAVSDSGLHLLVPGYNGQFYLRSGNDGASWDALGGQGFLVLSNASYPELRADADHAYVVYNQYGAPETSRLFFTKIYKNDSAFSAPAPIFSNVSYKTTVYVKDLDVSGTRVALLSYAQSWYGGYAKYFLHQSADGGATWTGGEQPGQGAHAALRPATGSISYLTPDTGPGGAGLYFQSRPFAWSSWKQGYANVWAGEGTADGLRWVDNKLLAVSQRNGLRYCSVGSVNAEEIVSWGAPVLVDSDNRWAIKDLSDGVNMHLLVADYASNPAYYYSMSTRSGSAAPVQWVGNTYHWPGNSELDAWDDLWINTEVFPKGAAVTGEVVYTTDGSNWFSKALAYAGATAANDQRHANLGKFPAGTTVRYALKVVDGAGIETWDNNGGQDFTARVSNNSNVAAPIFWGLDPYRYDNEKVRVNGTAADGSKSFGQFASDASITVVARPVENGNGNSVQQGTVSITSVLYYTTTPGNWDHQVAVTGVFHAAGFSNKPIFDYFSYTLGVLPPGSSVQFWLKAENPGGTAYAQAAGQDFRFTTAGSSNGDTDNDGLPDAWEIEWFTNLDQDADGNPDGDGVSGIPYANIIEWAVKGQPTIPNDPTGVKLMWSPAYPAPGDTVTLSYFFVNEGNPLFGKPVYAHVGHDGWKDVYDTSALQFNGGVSRLDVQIQVPAGAAELNVVFHDNAGAWDNNGGQDWHIPVRPVPLPTALEIPAPSPASISSADLALVQAISPAAQTLSSPEVSAPPAVLQPAATPARECPSVRTAAGTTQRVTLLVKGFPKQEKLYAHIGQDGWKQAVDVPMKKRRDGSFTVSYHAKAGLRDINVALRDGRGAWFTNGGGGWVFTVAGNDEQTLVITR